MRKLFLLIGVILFVMGLLWVGQGLGYINWPQSSFMINENKWTYYGAGTAFIGLLFMWFSRR